MGIFVIPGRHNEPAQLHTDRRASGSFIHRKGKLVEVQARKESKSSSIVLAKALWRLGFFAFLFYKKPKLIGSM